MQKAIGSKIEINDCSNETAKEFYGCISDLLETPEVQRLDSCEQHCRTSRLQHSLNVSYYSYLICKALRLDFRSAARGGLLHDLFFYDWREENLNAVKHSSLHPRVALDNAKKICGLNEKEKDMIVKHMWPMTVVPPKYRESYAVTFADKYCASIEFITQGFAMLFRKNKTVKANAA